MNAAVTYGEPAEQYHRREADVASNSGLTILDDQSPMHYRYWIDHPEDDEDTPALAFGQAFHTATLEPHKFHSLYCVLPADAPNRPTIRQINAKKPSPETVLQIAWWEQWQADHRGMRELTTAQYDEVLRMGAQIRAHVLEIPVGEKIVRILGSELFDLCKKEVTIRWVDERTGVKCKMRADLECDEFDFGGDLKSAANAHPRAFARAVAEHRYHQQHAHYTEGWKAIDRPKQNFLFFVVEKGKVNAPGVYHIPAEAQRRGHELRDRGLDTLKRCLDTGRWPTYTNTIHELTLPMWAYYD